MELNIFQQLYSMADTIIVQSNAVFCGEAAHAQTEALQQTRTGRNPV